MRQWNIMRNTFYVYCQWLIVRGYVEKYAVGTNRKSGYRTHVSDGL